MWNDLMRRWMDLALWWVPGRNRNAEHSDAPANSAPAAPSAPSAEEKEPAPAAPEVNQATGGSEDLTAIKGIGPAMQKRLAGLGIVHVADLAAADAKTLTEQLKAGKAVVSESQVSAWIEAAAGRA